MSTIQTHPRRRPIKSSQPHAGHSMLLRKSGTFSSPKPASVDVCDLDNYQYMPRRSPTCTESLEQLLLDDVSIQRVSNLLKDFDSKLAGHKSSVTACILQDPEVLPLPSFLLDNTSMDSTPMDIDPKSPATERNLHEHASDSGLGSSISGSKYGDRRSVSTSISTTRSAITHSLSALEEKRPLSEFASQQIRQSIVEPILAEESLKDFHPLIQDVPRRIGEKYICNLRDLEKTLIFLAPEFSATPVSYERFCNRSVELLRATYATLPEDDQRLPTDRPYNTNYFLDLMEQIRRYAAITAATREKEARGEELDEMDYSRDEKIALRGGLSHNGRPAHLVREKNGKTIPVVDGADEGYNHSSSKRALSDDEIDDEGVNRSMARRRKSDKPGDVMHTCRDCKKEFKRPCDLTKHEKTHSRPWKCTDEKCKYFELGWPTEKERDRHVNDKHSAAPPQYKCHYQPCTYASKRESNCKQHMEKAHGWNYVRSKSNGRKKAPTASGSERSPPTPLTPFIVGTPVSGMPTPETPFMASPPVPMINDFNFPYGFGTPALSAHGLQDDFRRDSVTTTEGSLFTYSSGPSPIEPSSFENAVTPDDINVNHNDIFNTTYNPTFQQPTPALSTGFDNFDNFNYPLNPVNGNMQHLSPVGQADMTLYSPQLSMEMDEGFSEAMPFTRPTTDFTLFDTAQSNNMNVNADFFPELNQFGGQFDNSLYAEPNANNFDDMMGMNFGNPQ